MLFYVLMNNSNEIHYSPLPEVDMLLDGWSKFLNPGFPLHQIQRYAEVGYDSAKTDYIGEEKQKELEKEIVNRLRKRMLKENVESIGNFEWREIKTDIFSDRNRLLEDEELYQKFIEMTDGKQLAEGELLFLRNKLGIKEEELLGLMQKAVLEKIAEWVPVFRRERFNYCCERCGSSNYQEWPSIYGNVLTCEDCKVIGAINSLQVLYRLKAKRLKPGQKGEVNRTMNDKISKLELTPAQTQAEKELEDHVQVEKAKETLLWAACGAGKTEVCFAIIRSFLQEKKNVLFAAPRQDVVHDIQPRLQINFPEYNVKILSGAMPPDLEPALLTVATTHQVIRFYRCFDLIIFDEVDAFPYNGSKTLEYGINHAVRENGQTIYLTATPTQEMLQKVLQKKVSLIRLPARHHGYPLPVPEWRKTHLPEERLTRAEEILKEHSLTEIERILREVLRKGPILIFVPTVIMVKEWIKVLKNIFFDKRVNGSWGSDPERRSNVASLINGSSEIFVCTSILERGVTVKNLQVVVLYAHHKLYETRALVQMAGRTGRTAEYPTGSVLFLSPRRTQDMAAAIEWINEQNTLAEKGGFLNV